MTDLCRVFLFIYLIIVMIFFPSMIPRKTAIKPRILLASTLSSAILVFSGTHKYHRVESKRRESRETTEKTSE